MSPFPRLFLRRRRIKYSMNSRFVNFQDYVISNNLLPLIFSSPITMKRIFSTQDKNVNKEVILVKKGLLYLMSWFMLIDAGIVNFCICGKG